MSLDSLLGRITSTSCTLSPTATTRKSSCNVTPTALDTGVMAPGASYVGNSSFFGSIGVLTSPLLGFTVQSAPLTITADDSGRIYGEANPTFTASYATFVNGDDEGDLLGTLSCTTTATALSDVNTYPITCNGLSSPISTIYPLSSTPHYAITYEPGTLTINQATLDITADPQSRGYGQANPTLTATFDTFLNGDDASDLDDPVVCSTSADSSSPVGSYDITCVAGPDNNYDLHFFKGSLTVTDADLTITAEDKSRLVGAANPTFTVKYVSFQGTDDEGDLGGTLNCTTAADSNSVAGDYPITCDGLTSDNYDIQFVAGTLHVLAAPGGSLPGGTGSYQAGGSVDVDVHDFKPGTTVLVNGCGIVDGEILIDGDGNGHATFTLPPGMDSTKCELTITGTDNTDGPADVVLTMEVLGLVPTGSSSLPLGLTAGLAVLLGFGLLTLARRRHAFR